MALSNREKALNKCSRKISVADKKFELATREIRSQHKVLIAEAERMYQAAIKPFHDELEATFDKAGREYDEVAK